MSLVKFPCLGTWSYMMTLESPTLIEESSIKLVENKLAFYSCPATKVVLRYWRGQHRGSVKAPESGVVMKRILIIDDNVDTASVLATILDLKGHTCLAVHTPVEGLSAVAEFSPHIVFLDIGMPVMNGYQVAARIRSDNTLRQPYLIAFTAWDDAASVAQAKLVGFDLHLTKTSSFEVLMATIQAVRVSIDAV